MAKILRECLSMHPYGLIVLTDRRSDGLYTILDDSNTLIHQSSGTNDAPRDPPAWPRYKRLYSILKT